MREIGARSEPLRFPRESGGPGAAVGPLPRNGPQRSGLSAGMVYEFLKKTPPSVPRRLCSFHVLLLATEGSAVPGSRPSPGRRCDKSAPKQAPFEFFRLLHAPLRFPRESGGPGAAVGPLSRNGPQRSGVSAGAMLELA